MTVVRLTPQVPAEVSPARGFTWWAPITRRVSPSGGGAPSATIMPAAFKADLVAGTVDVSVDPTTAGWVWCVLEAFAGVPARRRYFAVPNAGVVNYADLVEVDSASLSANPVSNPDWLAPLEMLSGSITAQNATIASATAPKLDTTAAAATYATRTTAAARRGARYAVLGDSLASFGFGYPTAENASASGAFYANWAQLTALLTKGEIVFTERQGFPGQTTAQILARVPYVISSGVRGAIVLGGANDHNPATTITNLTAIYTQLRTAGLEAIACLIPPQNDSTEVGYRARINSWIQAYAERHNMTVIDLHTPLVDPLTGQYKTGLFYDAVHMNQKGHLAQARYIVPRLLGRIGGGGWRPRLATYVGDSYNLFGNGLFTNADGSAGLDNGLSSVPAGGATGYTYSRIASAPGDDISGGNWQRIARAAGAGAVGNVTARRTLTVTTSGGPLNIGDRISFAGAIKAAGYEATATGSFTIQVAFSGTTAAAPQSFSIQWQLANQWTADVSGTFYEEHEIPVGTTALQINFTVAPGTDATTFDFGGIRLENLTTMGALAP